MDSNGYPKDYASLDLADETVANQLIQEQLDRGQVKPKRKRPPVVAAPLPQLPFGMLGQGTATAATLLEIARKCGKDRECWRSELLKRTTTVESSPTPVPFAGGPQATT